jgi:hypothetical protein
VSIDGEVTTKNFACHNQGALTYWLEQWIVVASNTKRVHLLEINFKKALDNFKVKIKVLKTSSSTSNYCEEYGVSRHLFRGQFFNLLLQCKA